VRFGVKMLLPVPQSLVCVIAESAGIALPLDMVILIISEQITSLTFDFIDHITVSYVFRR
jgi:hypothetical protein